MWSPVSGWMKVFVDQTLDHTGHEFEVHRLTKQIQYTQCVRENSECDGVAAGM